MNETNIVYSVNGYDFNYEELCDMCDEELFIGDTIYSGTAKKPTPSDLIYHQPVIDYIVNTACDIAGEYAEYIEDSITDEAKQELDELLEFWVTKHVNIKFYEVIDTKEIIIDDNIYNEIYN